MKNITLPTQAQTLQSKGQLQGATIYNAVRVYNDQFEFMRSKDFENALKAFKNPKHATKAFLSKQVFRVYVTAQNNVFMVYNSSYPIKMPVLREFNPMFNTQNGVCKTTLFVDSFAVYKNKVYQINPVAFATFKKLGFMAITPVSTI